MVKKKKAKKNRKQTNRAIFKKSSRSDKVTVKSTQQNNTLQFNTIINANTYR